MAETRSGLSASHGLSQEHFAQLGPPDPRDGNSRLSVRQRCRPSRQPMRVGSGTTLRLFTQPRRRLHGNSTAFSKQLIRRALPECSRTRTERRAVELHARSGSSVGNDRVLARQLDQFASQSTPQIAASSSPLSQRHKDQNLLIARWSARSSSAISAFTNARRVQRPPGNSRVHWRPDRSDACGRTAPRRDSRRQRHSRDGLGVATPRTRPTRARRSTQPATRRRREVQPNCPSWSSWRTRSSRITPPDVGGSGDLDSVDPVAFSSGKHGSRSPLQLERDSVRVLDAHYVDAAAETAGGSRNGLVRRRALRARRQSAASTTRVCPFVVVVRHGDFVRDAARGDLEVPVAGVDARRVGDQIDALESETESPDRPGAVRRAVRLERTGGLQNALDVVAKRIDRAGTRGARG